MLENLLGIYCSITHEKLVSTVSKLSAKRFVELHSDRPKLLLGPMSLIEVIEI